MSSLARRNTSVISASMDRETGEEPGGCPGTGLRVEEENGEREENRAACRRKDSFIASLSRSLVLAVEEEMDKKCKKQRYIFLKRKVKTMRHVSFSTLTSSFTGSPSLV